MPVDWSKYPENWSEIATEVKDTAGWKCQVCGVQCRKPGDVFLTHRLTLTVAHINHVESDCRPENLVAACAPCHLKYDAERKRWQKLARQRIESRSKQVLF